MVRRRGNGAVERRRRLEWQKPKEIIKEGLSEYFIYTIEGTETIPNGWSKRMRSFEGHESPSRSSIATASRSTAPQLVRMYLLANDKESKLGTTPLPDGMVRVFRQNGRDGLSFLVAQAIKYVPIGDKIELNLGPDPEVIFELVQLRVWRDNIWMQLQGRHLPAGGRPGRADRGQQHAWPAGTTTRSTPSGSATTRPSRSRWRSAARFPGTSSSAAGWRRRTTTTRPSSTPPR